MLHVPKQCGTFMKRRWEQASYTQNLFIGVVLEDARPSISKLPPFQEVLAPGGEVKTGLSSH